MTSSKQADVPRSIINWRAMLILGLCMLSMLGGQICAYYKTFPYTILHKTMIAFDASKQKHLKFDPQLSDRHTKVNYDFSGVTKHDPDHALNGYTLYLSSHNTEARLIDMKGDVIHTWSCRFSKLWKKPPHVKAPVPDDKIFFRKARIYPNGDLLAMLQGDGDTPYGYGLVRLDRDSNVIWKYAGNTHHDFDCTEDGAIYVLTQRFEAKNSHFNYEIPALVDDYVHLSPDGQEVERISIVDALGKAGIALKYNEKKWDFIHANSIDYISREEAEKWPFAREGQVLISLRNVSALAIVDPIKKTVTWTAMGGWKFQHDADILANGNIMLFDNKGVGERKRRSRILEFDPLRQRTIWEFIGDVNKPFYSALQGCQQPLSNGNVLITQSEGGRLLEVSRDGDIVWEFYNPERMKLEKDIFINNIEEGKRYTPDELAFLHKQRQ